MKVRIICLSETSWLDGLTNMSCQVLSIIVLWDARLCAGNKVHVMIKIGHLYLRHRFIDFSLRSSVERRPATSFSQLAWGMVVKKTVKYNYKCMCFQSNAMFYDSIIGNNFGHFDHHQTITTYNLKDWLYVVYIHFKLYGIPFTPISNSVNNLQFCCL